MKRQELTMSERSEIAKRYLRHESTAEAKRKGGFVRYAEADPHVLAV